MKTTLGRRWLSLFLTLAMCLTLAPSVWADDGDGGGDPPVVTEPKYEITLNKTTATLYMGKTETLTATVKKDGTEVSDAVIAWTSNPETVATVSNGVVTPVAAGTATITATYTPEPAPDPTPGPGTDPDAPTTRDDTTPESVTITATCEITVKPAVTDITATLAASTLSLVEGESKALPAITVKDNNGETVDAKNYIVTWSGGDAAVATVANNNVTAVKAGTTTFTGTVTYTFPGSGNELRDSVDCTVTVQAKMNKVTLDKSDIVMEVGKYESVTATADPDSARVTWSSDDPSVVDPGTTGKTTNLYGRKPGRATVTATIGEGSNKKSGTVSVTVSGLDVDTSSITVEENSTAPLPEVRNRYGAAANGTLSWQSSNPNVAQISGNNVAGRSPGTATISVTVGGNYRVDVRVTVETDSSTTIGPIKLRGSQTLSFQNYTSQFANQADGGLSHLTGIYVDPSQGTLFYGYTSADEPNEGVAQRDSYYLNPGNGQKDLKRIVFVPNPQFEGGQVTISYTVISNTYQNRACRMILDLDQSQANDITLSASNTTPARFNGNTFNRLCVQETGAELDYVIFSLPPSGKGTLYYDYITAGNYGGTVASGAMYRRADLDNIVFVPAAGVTGEVTIYYTARDVNPGGKTYSGKVIINVRRENVAGNGGPVYNISRGATQTFDDGDFGDYCEDDLGLGTLSYIQFGSLPSSGQGTLYHNYRSTSSTGTLVQTGVSYYYGTRSPRLDRITFVPAEDFIGTVRLPFTGWDTSGNRFSGYVEINVQGSGGTGSIRYSCIPGRTVEFTLSDFTNLSRELTDRTLSYIIFQDLPNRSTQGSLYHSSTRVSATGTRYYNTSGTYWINKLSFHAVNGFTGSVDIPFVGYTSASGVTFNGVLTIDAANGGSGDTNISYYTDYGTPVVFARDDFNEISLDETGSNISSVKFSIPSTSRGDLYRNYRSATSKGTRISSSSTSISSSGLSQVAFIPTSGFVGTVYIDYTATATNSAGTFTGTIEIEVEQPGADVVVRYTTRTAPVDFQRDDFRRSGTTLSSIKFNALPSTEQGKLYYQYTSPTQFTRLAATSTSYSYATSGSSLISNLTFVPRAGFTGTVTLPYTGTNSNRTTFEGEVIITVLPTTTSARFTDLGGYSNEQRSAVEYIYENGVTVGISETQYGPELYITRGDFAVMVYKAFGFAPSGSSWVFNDVPPNVYYAQAVNTLYAKGIVSGVGNGDYAPTAYVSRQDAVCMVQRAMRAVNWGATDGSFSTLAGYSDAAYVAAYAQGAMALAVHQGYLPIDGQTLAPGNPLTRIDMAQVLHRVLTY